MGVCEFRSDVVAPFAFNPDSEECELEAEIDAVELSGGGSEFVADSSVAGDAGIEYSGSPSALNPSNLLSMLCPRLCLCLNATGEIDAEAGFVVDDETASILEVAGPDVDGPVTGAPSWGSSSGLGGRLADGGLLVLGGNIEILTALLAIESLIELLTGPGAVFGLPPVLALLRSVPDPEPCSWAEEAGLSPGDPGVSGVGGVPGVPGVWGVGGSAPLGAGLCGGGTLSRLPAPPPPPPPPPLTALEDVL